MAKLLNINYLNKYKDELESIEGIELIPTYDCGDLETEYDISYNGIVVAGIITRTDNGLIKYFAMKKDLPKETISMLNTKGLISIEK